MNELLRICTVELVRFLTAKLPLVGQDWWRKNVEDRLTFQQQRTIAERKFTSLQQLDLAALLRVLDQNWYELSNALPLPREGRSWVKELQTVRNKWAHLSGEVMPPSEVYRDADTMGRLLAMIETEKPALAAVESVKASAVAAMAATPGYTDPAVKPHAGQSASPIVVAPIPVNTAASLFKIGDLVALRADPNPLMPVIEVLPGGAETRYRVFHNGKKETLYESQLLLPTVGNEERKTLSADSLCAHLTAMQLLSPSTSALFSLRSGRVKFVPYQYRPVLKLIRADRPRLLIADEVGVGKTIEAGLIIKELQARMGLSSVLVICPKALVAERKWFTEMRRFDEDFTALDGAMLRQCLDETDKDGEWPAKYAKAILPFSLFDSDLLFGRNRHGKQRDTGLLSLDPAPKFDLVIVDEAHHIRNSDTFLHQGVRYFCDNAEAVVFLTATPVQLGSTDLYTLLNVLRPDLIIDSASFEQMAEPNRYINAAVQQCRAGRAGWQETARKSLEALTQTEWGRMFVRESPAFQAAFDRLGDGALVDADRVALTHEIEGLYTFSSIINRTRRRDIGKFTTRKPETVNVEFTEEQRRLHDGLLEVIARILVRCHGQQSVKFMMTTIRRQAASCLYGLAPLLNDILNGKLDRLEVIEASDEDNEIEPAAVDDIRADVQDVLSQAQNLEPYDPKVEAFLQVLRDKSRLDNNKALVFSTFRHTLAYLAQHVAGTDLRYGLIHGSIPEEERRELRQRFRLGKHAPEAIDVLLSSEVGCEGLDFEFCDLLVNYDLPWNPMRIEQRIGRLDRYGQQSEAVAIVNLITPGTVDADIYERCLSRIGVFQHAVGGNEEILGEITQALHDIAESFTLTAEDRSRRLRQLADNAIRQLREEEELESKQAELFGLSVPARSWRDDIEAAESYWLSPAAIQACVEAYLRVRLGSGGEQLLGEKPLKTLRLGQEARAKLLDDHRVLPRSNDPVARQWEKWLKGAQPNLPVTFDQEAAAASPLAAHLSVLHPLVRQASRFLELQEPAFVSIKANASRLPAGVHQFALYQWRQRGVRTDEALVVVASDPDVEAALLEVLPSASDLPEAALPTSEDIDALDKRHYCRWSEARANHASANQQLVEHRIQSLTVSHRARHKLIEERVCQATNDKIRLMRESELARADADFNARMQELQQGTSGADILAKAVVFGIVSIVREGGK